METPVTASTSEFRPPFTIERKWVAVPGAKFEVVARPRTIDAASGVLERLVQAQLGPNRKGGVVGAVFWLADSHGRHVRGVWVDNMSGLRGDASGFEDLVSFGVGRKKSKKAKKARVGRTGTKKARA